jgi:dTDP-4-dehydrorhamnose 3,5-epimerase
MNIEHQIIEANMVFDYRGSLSYLNEFSLKPIDRFYKGIPNNISIIRTWQAHKKEFKWFYCTQGAILTNLIKLDSFLRPSKNSPIFTFDIKELKLEEYRFDVNTWIIKW